MGVNDTDYLLSSTLLPAARFQTLERNVMDALLYRALTS